MTDQLSQKKQALENLPETTLEDLVGCAGYQGPTVSLEEMERAIAIGASLWGTEYSEEGEE
jgi:hypothetical protein